MAVQGIDQPAIIHIDETLRLRKFDGIGYPLLDRPVFRHSNLD